MTTPNTLHADLSDALELLSKATPGEWRSFSHKDYGDDCIGVAPVNGSDVADCSINMHRSFDDRTANAQLIAAAVNLLRTHGAALLEAAGREVVPEDARDWLSNGDPEYDTPTDAFVRRLLAAAPSEASA